MQNNLIPTTRAKKYQNAKTREDLSRLNGLTSLAWKAAGRDFYSSAYYAKKSQEDMEKIRTCE